MPNLKLDFSRHICAAGQSLVNALPLDGAPPPCSLTYLSKLSRRSAAHISPVDDHQQLPQFRRQGKILDMLVTTILILYPKLYRNIVSIVVLNIEARQYNIKINLAISCSPNEYILIEFGSRRNKYLFRQWDSRTSAKSHDPHTRREKRVKLRGFPSRSAV